MIGDFSGTSLRLNTITIDGDAGDDTIDISALTSAHRIVFKSNGGHDTIVGTLRPQDVIELPAGTTPDDYVTTTDENGVTTMSSANHSIRFTSEGGLPEFAGTDDGGTDDGGDDDVQAPPPNPTPPTPVATTGALIAGTALSNVLIGTASGETIVALAGNDTVIGDGGADVVRADEGDDFVSAGDGNDMAFGGDGNDDMFGGDGNDMLYGDAGSDRIFGDAGNDMIHAGAGNDIAYGGTGNDMVVAGANDGDDIYYGDADIDTLDMSSITANLNVDIGSGFMGQGSASSSQSGHDTLWGFENIVTGAGNDTITANASVNIIEGGAGSDTFRFLSEAAADGDTITSFQAGDKIDLSGADADSGLAGNQAFTLVSGSTLSGPAQIAVSHETREDGDYTVVSGSVDSDATAEFRLNIKGNHNLTSTDFNL